MLNNASLISILNNLTNISGLSSEFSSLQTVALPCIKIKCLQDNNELAIGASKIGGTPDLPANIVWPTYNEIPLRFVAQINLSELPGHYLNYLPDSGILFFFIGDDEPSFNIKNSVIFSENLPCPTKNPINGPENYDNFDFPVTKITFFPWISLPTYHESSLQLSEKFIDLYDNLLYLIQEEGGVTSQLGGYLDAELQELRKKSLCLYYKKDIKILEHLTLPLYPIEDIEAAKRMRLQTLENFYERKYQQDLKNHKLAVDWFNLHTIDMNKYNLLLSLNSHNESEICWWNAGKLNFMDFESAMINRDFTKIYSEIDSA